MIPLSRDEIRGGIILIYCIQSITIFLEVDYTILWKPKDVKTATVILFNYEIF